MPNNMPSPCFVMEKEKLDTNLKVFTKLQKETDSIWFYTLKCFHEKDGLSHIANVLSGFSIGNLNELSQATSFPYTHIHAYAPAFYESEVIDIAKASHTMSFNSITQWNQHSHKCILYTSLGLRINPKLALKQPAYCDVSSIDSRFGIDYSKFIDSYQKNPTQFKHLEGLHFHTFCHQELPALKSLLNHISHTYKDILPTLKWLNLGGGQNFTDPSYELEVFIEVINDFQQRYPHLTLYFEPGSTVVNHTGYFKCTILDIIEDKVILDTSIETHLLDVAITKRQLTVRGASKSKTPYAYKLTGVSCIAGDIMGTYYFDVPLHIGDTIIFENMMGYTLVKQTEFNGIKKAKFYLEK